MKCMHKRCIMFDKSMGREQVVATAGFRGKIPTDHSVENTLDSLTSREREVLGLIANGFSNKTIAEELVLGVKSVENYNTEVYRKIGLSVVDPMVDKRVQGALLYKRKTPDFKNPVEGYFGDNDIASLTSRQKEVVSLIEKGYSNKGIARQLEISLKTVENYINRILSSKIPVNHETHNGRVVLALFAKTKLVVK